MLQIVQAELVYYDTSDKALTHPLMTYKISSGYEH